MELKATFNNVDASDRFHVCTLLGHVPETSLGLKTSFFGKIFFVASSTCITLSLLKREPKFFLCHMILFCISYIAIFFWGARKLLFCRPVFMLILACGMIALVNFLFHPEGIDESPLGRLKYGLTRGFAFASLSFSTLLIASITRPSDPARFLSLFSSNKYLIILTAIPFATFHSISILFHDILLANQARNICSNRLMRIYSNVLGISAGLLAIMLNRANYLHQSVLILSKSNDERSRLLTVEKVLSVYDILFLVMVSPGFFYIMLT